MAICPTGGVRFKVTISSPLMGGMSRLFSSKVWCGGGSCAGRPMKFTKRRSETVFIKGRLCEMRISQFLL